MTLKTKPDLSENIKLILVKAYGLIAYLFYLLVGDLFGIFVFSLLLYYFAPNIGLSQPFTAQELVLWIEQLPDIHKTTIFSSLLTIIGFLIAFSIGSAQQRQQFISQMKIEAASDIEVLFTEISRKVTGTNIYAKYLLKVASIIKDSSDQSSIDFHMHNIINETNKFIQTRDALIAQSIEVHRLTGRYSIILTSSWSVNQELDKAIEAFNKIIDTIWFSTPIINPETKDKETVFMRHINIDECQKYIDTYDVNYLLMNKISGGIRGRLVGSITGMNLSFILALLKLKPE
jgi:hypothetical protein